MKLLLISGHGAGDPGAVGTFMGKTYREAVETIRVVEALAAALRGAAEVTIYPTDRNAFQDYKYGTLAAVAQFKKYDYVLEIHFNAFRGTEAADGRSKGTECFVTTQEEGVAVEEEIVRNLATLGLTNRGVKRRNWAVIQQAKQAGTSAALLEVCFIDDPDDMAVYTEQFPEVVQAIAAGIREGFGLRDALAAARALVQERAGLTEKTMDYLENYQYGGDLLKKLAAAMR